MKDGLHYCSSWTGWPVGKLHILESVAKVISSQTMGELTFIFETSKRILIHCKSIPFALQVTSLLQDTDKNVHHEAMLPNSIWVQRIISM